MTKKIFFITIPMLPTASLKKIKYRKEDRGELFSEPASFPGIVLLENGILGVENVKIVTVRTDDDNGRTNENYKRFKEELAQLSESIGNELNIDAEIVVPHSENRDKQMSFLKEICSQYEQDADVYMDVTYGTKITSIGMFSSLVFAEKLQRCNIKSVVYGKYSHNDTTIGDLYDVRVLYEMAMLINSADYMSGTKLMETLDKFWG